MKTAENDMLDIDGGTRARHTLRNYNYALKRFRTYAKGRAWSDGLIYRYLHYLRNQRKISYKSANTILYALKHYCEENNRTCPIGRETKRAMEAWRRGEAGTMRRGRVDAISWQQTYQLAAYCLKMTLPDGTEHPAGKRNAALFTTMSDAMLRVGEASNVRFGDIVFYPTLLHPSHAILTIPKSKTDQLGEGLVKYLGEFTAKTLRDWYQLIPADDRRGYVFRSVHHTGAIHGPMSHLHPNDIRSILKSAGKAIGLSPKINTHSFRRGGAEELMRNGVSLVEIQQAGGWKSPMMPHLYTRDIAAASSAIARIKYGKAADSPRFALDDK